MLYKLFLKEQDKEKNQRNYIKSLSLLLPKDHELNLLIQF